MSNCRLTHFSTSSYRNLNHFQTSQFNVSTKRNHFYAHHIAPSILLSIHIQTKFQWYRLHKSPIDFPKHSSKSILVATSLWSAWVNFLDLNSQQFVKKKIRRSPRPPLRSAWVKLSQRRRSPTNKGGSCTVPWYTLVFKPRK